jgi:hypothetical protein
MCGVGHIRKWQWQDYIVTAYLVEVLDQRSMDKCIGRHVSNELIVGHEA